MGYRRAQKGQDPLLQGRVQQRQGYCCTRYDFGETEHREAAVPVEVSPERDQPDQPDQPGRAGEMGVYPSGQFDGGFGLPSSRLAHKHSPTFSGLKEYFVFWARDVGNGIMQKE